MSTRPRPVYGMVDGSIHHGQNPRPRWLIDLAPLSLAGYQGTLYQQAKTFSLPATTDYQVGQTITFHYRLVPYAQQTPWKTQYEWLAEGSRYRCNENPIKK